MLSTVHIPKGINNQRSIVMTVTPNSSETRDEKKKKDRPTAKREEVDAPSRLSLVKPQTNSPTPIEDTQTKETIQEGKKKLLSGSGRDSRSNHVGRWKQSDGG